MSDTEQSNMLSAENIFKAQIDSARNYIDQEQALGFIQEPLGRRALFPTEDSLKTMEQHPFVHWLRQQPNFRQAVSSILEQKLFPTKRIRIEIINTYTEKLGLERLCAVQIVCFTNKNKTLPYIPVRSQDRQALLSDMKKVKHKLNPGALYFPNAAKQLLFGMLLEELIDDDTNNVFSSRKTHDSLLRQAFIKFLLAGLFRTYTKISLEISAIVALDMLVFFSLKIWRKRML